MSENCSTRVTVAAVVFGFDITKGLHVLLDKRIKSPFKSGYCIPETTINFEENAIGAIERELEDQASLKVAYISQMHSYTDVNRDPRGPSVCITYLAIVNQKTFERNQKTNNWQSISDLPPLAFDHNQIIQQAIIFFQNKLTYQPIAFNLLNNEFTFSELEKVYTQVTKKIIDRRNFKKKILNYQLLTPVNKKIKSPGRGRPAELFKLNKSNYRSLMKSGFHIEI